MIVVSSQPQWSGTGGVDAAWLPSSLSVSLVSVRQMPTGQEIAMKYQMDGGTVVDTSKSSQHWEENTRWDGRNHISVATGSQWDHETLYRSRKGRYYVVHESQWQGSTPHAEWVSEHEAVRWLLANGHDEDIPADIVALVDEVSE